LITCQGYKTIPPKTTIAELVLLTRNQTI